MAASCVLINQFVNITSVNARPRKVNCKTIFMIRHSGAATDI